MTIILQISACIAMLLLLAGLFTAARWPFIGDAPLMHYIVFLMHKGFAPYRDIIDMNMPGSYLAEALIIRILGPAARGLFLADLLSAVLVVLASMWISGSKHRASGLIAGSLACLMHLADGAWDLGQRDWIVATLLLLSFGCFTEWARGSRNHLWIGAGFLCATLAATIKPPALLFPCVAFISLCVGRGFGPKKIGVLACTALAGMFLPVTLIVVFLVKWKVAASFFEVSKGLIPYYASLQKESLRYMLWQSLANREKLFAAGIASAAVLMWVNRSWRSFEMKLLLLGSFCGILSYLVQAKGFTYHRYPAIAFLALFMVLQIEKGLRQRGPIFYLALLTLIVSVLGVSAASLRRERSVGFPAYYTALHLKSDLASLGGAQLSGHVQCLDMTWAGCINVLYQTQVVQSTGFIYDFYLFPERGTTLTAALQKRFFGQVSANPPRVFVLSKQVWPGDSQSYDQVSRWPLFKSFLDQHYRLSTEYVGVKNAGGYRIYLLR